MPSFLSQESWFSAQQTRGECTRVANMSNRLAFWPVLTALVFVTTAGAKSFETAGDSKGPIDFVVSVYVPEYSLGHAHDHSDFILSKATDLLLFSVEPTPDGIDLQARDLLGFLISCCVFGLLHYMRCCSSDRS